MQGIRLAGRAPGHNRLEWPLGKFGREARRGGSHRDDAGGRGADDARTARPTRSRRSIRCRRGRARSISHLWIGYVPIAGHIAYTLDPEWITIGSGSWAATEKTYVEFKGRTAWGQHSQIPFHVTSVDWQESDRVLAGIMTAFGAPTGAIPIGGRGEFDGVMLESFSRPRIEGHFAGDRMRAWDTSGATASPTSSSRTATSTSRRA